MRQLPHPVVTHPCHASRVSCSCCIAVPHLPPTTQVHPAPPPLCAAALLQVVDLALQPSCSHATYHVQALRPLPPVLRAPDLSGPAARVHHDSRPAQGQCAYQVRCKGSACQKRPQGHMTSGHMPRRRPLWPCGSTWGHLWEGTGPPHGSAMAQCKGPQGILHLQQPASLVRVAAAGRHGTPHTHS